MLCQEDALKAARNIVQRPAHTESAEGAARLAAEGGRRQARQRAEARAERAEALIADLEADFRHAVVAGQQRHFGPLDAPRVTNSCGVSLEDWVNRRLKYKSGRQDCRAASARKTG